MSDRLLLDVLACAGWLLWAVFTLDLVRALPDATRTAHRAATARTRLRPADAAQLLAQNTGRTGLLRTVTVVLLAAIITGLLSMRPHTALAASGTGATGTGSPGSAARPTPAVQSTNRGVPAAPPAGQDLREVLERTVTVQPPHDGTHDSLWRIAQRTLGDGSRWRALYQLNKDRPQPDGQTLQDPALIQPGWVLRLPAPPNGHQTPATPHPGSRTTPAPAPPPAPPPAPSRHTPSTRVSSPAAPSIPSTPRSAETVPPPAPATSTAPSLGPRAASQQSYEPTWVVPAFAAGGAILAAFCLAALNRRRRQQWRHRHPGRGIAVPGTSAPGLVPLEQALRQAGTSRTVADLGWVDHALRHLAAAVTTEVPDVLAARLDDAALELILYTPATNPPPPWTTNNIGNRWRIALDDLGHPAPPTQARKRSSMWAPYPALVSFGDDVSNQTAQHWWIDLESASPLILTGDAERCRDLAHFLTAELAHNPWSDHLHVTLVGFAPDLVQLNPDRISHADNLNTVLAQVRTELAATDAVDVLRSRVDDLDSDACTPHVIITAAPGDGPTASLSELRATLADAATQTRRRPVALIVCEADCDANGVGTGAGLANTLPPGHGLRVHLSADGTATLGAPLHLSLAAHQLPADQASDLAALFALADTLADQPIPPARGDQPWEQNTDAVGAPLLTPAPPTPAPVDATSAATTTTTDTSTPGTLGSPDKPNADAEQPRRLLTLPDARYLTHGATTPSDLHTLAPPLPAQRRQELRQADPALDDDLAIWNDPHAAVPKLHLLGPLDISGVPEPPAKRAALLIELVAYLATHPRGVTVEQLAADLWPHIPDAATKTTPRQSVSLARQWLGTNPATGHARLPHASTDRAGSKLYRLNGVLVDADLFRRLRVRAHAASEGGTDLLWAALGLVTGAPFANRRPAGYSWLTEMPLDHEYTAMIVDVAHLLATDALAHNDPDRAARAAQIALDAGAVDDIALLDLAAACEARGDHAQTQALVHRVMTNHDAEIFEDLPPRTYDVLRRRHWITT